MPVASSTGALHTRLLGFMPYVGLPILLLVVVRHGNGPVLNPDTYFHLRLGAEFLSSWDPTSPGSVTRFATADWVPTQWLGQLALAKVEGLGGLTAVSALTALTILAAVLTIFSCARSQTSFGPALVLTAVAVLVCLPFFSGRPQVVSYALAAVVTAGWLKCADGGRIPWWIIPLTWLWAMVHGMWSVSVIVSAAAVLGMTLDRRVRVANAWRFLAVPVLSLGSAALTPLGTGLYDAVARVGSISDYFEEWGPTDFSSVNNLAALGVAAAVVLMACRRESSVSWVHLSLAGLGILWLVYSGRTVPVGIAVLVVVASANWALISSKKPVTTPERYFLVATSIVAAAVAVSTAHSPSVGLRATSAAHASVAALAPGTGLLNEWTEGGYDMWRHPRLNILMHGYGDMFTDDELRRNDGVLNLAPGWYEEIQCLGIRNALLYSQSPVANALVQDKGWRIVAADGPREPEFPPGPSVNFEEELLLHLQAATDPTYSDRECSNVNGASR